MSIIGNNYILKAKDTISGNVFIQQLTKKITVQPGKKKVNGVLCCSGRFSEMAGDNVSMFQDVLILIFVQQENNMFFKIISFVFVLLLQKLESSTKLEHLSQYYCSTSMIC